jgi:hypothetical protein
VRSWVLVIFKIPLFDLLAAPIFFTLRFDSELGRRLLLFSCSRFLFQNFSSVDLFCLLVRPLHFSFEARCPCREPAAAACFSRLCASAGSVSAAHCIRSHAVKDFTVSGSAPAIFAADRIFLFCATLVRSSVTRGWNLSARLLSVSVFHFSRGCPGPASCFAPGLVSELFPLPVLPSRFVLQFSAELTTILLFRFCFKFLYVEWLQVKPRFYS